MFYGCSCRNPKFYLVPWCMWELGRPFAMAPSAAEQADKPTYPRMQNGKNVVGGTGVDPFVRLPEGDVNDDLDFMQSQAKEKLRSAERQTDRVDILNELAATDEQGSTQFQRQGHHDSKKATQSKLRCVASGRSESLKGEDKWVEGDIEIADRLYRACGVFDGHGGSEAASLCAGQIFDIIRDAVLAKPPHSGEYTFDDVANALPGAFERVHREVRGLDDGKCTAGTTATILIIDLENRLVLCCNVGDSMVLAVDADKTGFISADHRIQTKYALRTCEHLRCRSRPPPCRLTRRCLTRRCLARRCLARRCLARRCLTRRCRPRRLLRRPMQHRGAAEDFGQRRDACIRGASPQQGANGAVALLAWGARARSFPRRQ